MIPGAGAVGSIFGGGAGGVSASSSASSTADQRSGAINIGGLNTGTQGLDMQTLAILAVVAVAIVLLLVRRR